MVAILKVKMRGFWVVTNGSSPFSQEDMRDLSTRVGARVAEVVDNPDKTYVVVGREEFVEETLWEIYLVVGSGYILSQEEYSMLLFFGGPSLGIDLAVRARVHPALQYLHEKMTKSIILAVRLLMQKVQNVLQSVRSAANTLRGKDQATILLVLQGLEREAYSTFNKLTQLRSEGHFVPVDYLVVAQELTNALRMIKAEIEEISYADFAEDWPVESVLKQKFGYNVQAQTSVPERRKALRVALPYLGFQKIVNQISAMIELHRSDKRMQEAVRRWGRDLEWFQRELGVFRQLWR